MIWFWQCGEVIRVREPSIMSIEMQPLSSFCHVYLVFLSIQDLESLFMLWSCFVYFHQMLIKICTCIHHFSVHVTDKSLG